MDLKSERGLKMVFDLADAKVEALDFGLLIEHLKPSVAAAAALSEEGGDLEDLFASEYEKFYTLADMFTPRVSINSLSLSGLSVSFNDQLTIALDSVTVEGPLKAGQIPLTQKATSAGFRVTLPTAAPEGTPLSEAAEFARDFGRSEFNLNYQAEASFDPATGVMKWLATPMLGEKDMFDLNFEFYVSGLSQALADRLADVPMSDPSEFLTNPEFSSLALASASLTLVNRSLADEIYAYVAKKSDSDAESVKEMAAFFVEVMFPSNLSSVIGDAEAAAADLAGFLRDPKVLKISMAPETPRSIQAFGAAERASDELNALNFGLTVNDGPTRVLTFVDSPAAPPDEDEGEYEGEYDERYSTDCYGEDGDVVPCYDEDVDLEYEEQ
jgi:hypothetical protein